MPDDISEATRRAPWARAAVAAAGPRRRPRTGAVRTPFTPGPYATRLTQVKPPRARPAKVSRHRATGPGDRSCTHGDTPALGTLDRLVRHTRVESIVGDTITVRARGPALGDLALVENVDGSVSTAEVVRLDGDRASLQVFAGGKGQSTEAQVRFLGHGRQVAFSSDVLGRVFDGAGAPIDGKPGLDGATMVDTAGPTVNPMQREVPTRLIETEVPMIDVFNTLVESQKLPVFSVAGEPYNALLARIGFQADADVVVFGGIGLIFDDYHFFRRAFEDHGVFHRTVMFVNQAADPIVERLLVPDACLAIAERFAVDQNKRVPAATRATSTPSSPGATRRPATSAARARSPSSPSPPCPATT